MATSFAMLSSVFCGAFDLLRRYHDGMKITSSKCHVCRLSAESPTLKQTQGEWLDALLHTCAAPDLALLRRHRSRLHWRQ